MFLFYFNMTKFVFKIRLGTVLFFLTFNIIIFCTFSSYLLKKIYVYMFAVLSVYFSCAKEMSSRNHFNHKLTSRFSSAELRKYFIFNGRTRWNNSVGEHLAIQIWPVFCCCYNAKPSKLFQCWMLMMRWLDLCS